MSDIEAKNIGSVVITPNAPVNITNIFNTDKDISLPSNVTSPKGFIGREDDLNDLRRAKTGGITSFVLHGAGGIGKTDLALKFIEENKTENCKAYQVNMLGLSENPTTWKNAMFEVVKAFKPEVSADLDELNLKSFYTALLNEHKPILFFDNAIDRNRLSS